MGQRSSNVGAPWAPRHRSHPDFEIKKKVADMIDSLSRIPVAIIGSGNIGTDLMFKIIRTSNSLEMGAMVGIDAGSDGLRRASQLDIPTTHEGVDGLIAMPGFDRIRVIFDATSAGAHVANAERLAPYDKILVDLTPAAIGPFVVPAVNLEQHSNAKNVNMVTCGGQATVPIVAAVSSVAKVRYAEIVASISSKSAGPGTRANIDEFTETTATALQTVGGAERGKAIIVLNPAEPPVIMRDTVMCLADDADPEAIRTAVRDMVAFVSQYVPGYRLKHDVQVVAVDDNESWNTLLTSDTPHPAYKVTVFLEVQGAAHYLPEYAGNLDIMTSAALHTAERLVSHHASNQKLEVG